MDVLIRLYLAHFIGDFVFQPSSWTNDKLTKKVKSPKLYYHLLIHLVLTVLLAWGEVSLLGMCAIILIHYVIDLSKLYLQKWYDWRILFWLDQLLHLCVIYWVGSNFRMHPLDLSIVDYNNNWNIALVLIITLFVSQSIYKMFLTYIDAQPTQNNHNSLWLDRVVWVVLLYVFNPLFILAYSIIKPGLQYAFERDLAIRKDLFTCNMLNVLSLLICAILYLFLTKSLH